MIHRTFQRRGPHGGLIRGDVRVPEGPAPRSAVVVVHGFKGFKDWAFFPWLCGRLAAAGHAVVSFNFTLNGLGDSLGDFTDLDAFGRNTLSRELDELVWLIDQVVDGDVLPWRPRSTALLGHSRGGGQAVLAAREDPRVDALVTWAAVANFDRWAEDTRSDWRRDGRVYVLNGRTGQQMPLDVTFLEDFEANRKRLDIIAAAAQVNVPWLVVHGREDSTVSSADAASLVAAGTGARLHLVDGAGHTFQVGHPFDLPARELENACTATIRHLAGHLGRA